MFRREGTNLKEKKLSTRISIRTVFKRAFFQQTNSEEKKISVKEQSAEGIRSVALVYLNNLDFFNNPTVEKSLDIAKNKGYEVIFMKLGDLMIDLDNKSVKLDSDNSVRIGLTEKGQKAFYIAVSHTDTGIPLVYDRKDLYHDVGAILLGGKRLKSANSAFFDANIFIDLIKEKSGIEYTISNLRSMGIYYEESKTVPDTWLLDALSEKTIPYRAVKYV